MISLEDNTANKKLLYINNTRIAILLVLILVSFAIKIFLKPPFPVRPIFVVLLSSFLLTLFNFIFIRIFKNRFVVYWGLVLDILTIAFLVYFSGGVESPFYFLYILPIIESSIFLSRKYTIYIASFSYILFGAISELMYLNLIPTYSGPSDETVPVGTFIYNLVMGMIAFASVAVISSYYFERIRKTGVELKNIQENLKDLDLLNSTVLEKMENGFLTCNANGTIISYNEKSKSILRVSSKANIFDLLFKDYDFAEIEQAVAANNRYYLETEIGDSVLGISISLLKQIYSFDKVFVFIITDLTEKREIEKKLKEKEHLALIGEMSAGMAHEIRNPLASISGSVQFLKRELKLTPEYKNLMDIIVKESDRLSKSIEEFLEFTKVTPLERSHFKLRDLLDDVVQLTSVNHNGIDFITKYSGDDKIFADRKKIEQVVWNLVNNAVKAVNGSGVVEINVYEREQEIFLSIKDDGSGIDSEELQNIFIPFYSQFTSGIGLGMPIVKRIVEEHHFDIKINSVKNIGTEVIVCFKESKES